MALALVMLTFVSPEGRIFEVSRDSLIGFAIRKGLIDGPSHASNVEQLIDPKSGKKQRQRWVPLHKLKLLQQIDKKTKLPLDRPPEPILAGNFEWYVNDFAPLVFGMEKIRDGPQLSRLFSKNPPPYYGTWTKAELTLADARQELLRRAGQQRPEQVIFEYGQENRL